MKSEITTNEIIELSTKQWADIKDIKMLACVGDNKAYKIKNEIIKDLKNKGYTLPKNLIPMDVLLKHLKINLNYHMKLKKQIRGWYYENKNNRVYNVLYRCYKRHYKNNHKYK